MAKVTMTGNVRDITGATDDAPVYFWTPYVRLGVLSPRRQYVVPDTNGDLSVQLEAGPAVVEIGGRAYEFTATTGDLWQAINVGLSVPAATSAEKLREVVDAWATSYGDSHYATPGFVTAALDAIKGGVASTYDTLAKVAAKFGVVDTALADRFTKTQSDARFSAIAHTHPTTSIVDLAEYIQDTVAALIKGGANVTTSYDDAANTFTINATGGGGGTDAEIVRDTIAGALVASSGISISVDDANDTITIAVAGVPQSAVTGLSSALAGKEPSIAAGTTAQYWRGDKTWQTLPTGNALTPEMFGAVGDGSTDDSVALQNMLNAAGGKTVVLSPSKTYRHTVVLTVGQDATTIIGGGTLLATAEQTSSVLVTGMYVTMRGVKLKMASTTQRWAEYEKMKLRVVGDYFYADSITIDGSAAVGVYTMSAFPTFVKCIAKNTRADGFFTSEGAHDVTFLGCTADTTGDDGFSVVSYADKPVYRYTSVACSVYNGGARGFSVVGGSDVGLFNIYVNVCAAAGVYLSSESNAYANVARIIVSGGEILGANASTTVDHGALLMVTAGARSMQYVDLSGFVIRNTRATAPAQLRVIRYDTSTINDVSMSNVSIFGGPTATTDLYQVTVAANRIYLANIVKDGVPLGGAGASGPDSRFLVQSVTIGDGSTLGPYTITHNMGTRAVQVSLRQKQAPFKEIRLVDVAHPSINALQILTDKALPVCEVDLIGILGTTDVTPPAKPSIAVASKTDTTVVLTPSGSDNVAIYGFNWFRGGTYIGTSLGTANFTDNTAASSTTYSYTATAVDTSGNESVASDALSVTTNAPSTPPVTSAAVNSQGNGNRAATLPSVPAGSTVYAALTHVNGAAAAPTVTCGGTAMTLIDKQGNGQSFVAVYRADGVAAGDKAIACTTGENYVTLAAWCAAPAGTTTAQAGTNGNSANPSSPAVACAGNETVITVFSTRLSPTVVSGTQRAAVDNSSGFSFLRILEGAGASPRTNALSMSAQVWSAVTFKMTAV